MDKAKTLKYLDDIWWGEQHEEYQIAKTMYILKSEISNLTSNEMYKIACRMTELGANCNEPFLRAELDDALRWVMSSGFFDCGYEVDAEGIKDVLLTCPQEVFEYMITSTAYENQTRYAVDQIKPNEKIIAWFDEQNN